MKNQDVSILEWIIVFIILSIPFINIIMIVIFAIGNFNQSLKNFAKALIFILIFGILLLTYFFGSLGQVVRQIPGF